LEHEYALFLALNEMRYTHLIQLAETGDGKDHYYVYHFSCGLAGHDEEKGCFQVKSLQLTMKRLDHSHIDY